MSYCCVPFCKSNKRKNGVYQAKKISFHEFPCDNNLREKWIIAISREDPASKKLWLPTDRSVICSLHFENKCFKQNVKVRKLLPDSVPTIFPVSQDPTILRRWIEAIQRTDNREFSEKNRISDLHFAKEQINFRNFETVKFPDGTEQSLEKTRPALASGAVPSKFPNCQKYLAKKSTKRKSPRSQKPLHKKGKNEDFLKDLISDKLMRNKKLPYLRSLLKKAENEDETSDGCRTPSPCSISPLNVKAENEDFHDVTSVSEDFHKDLISAKPEFSFSTLSNEIENIKKPNKWWAVSSHETFVVCVKWDVNAAPERQIVIDNNLNAQVLYYGSVTSNAGIVVESIENVSKFIGHVDGCAICINAKKGNTNCDVYTPRNWDSGRPQVLCSECEKKQIADKLAKQAISSTKNKHLYQHKADTKQKNSLLREKIMMLQNKLELTRKENFLIEQKAVEENAVTNLPVIHKISVEANMV